MDVVISWSGGKESSLVCYQAISDGLSVLYLLNMISNKKRCMAHGLDFKLIIAQSQAIEIPIVQIQTTWNTYEREFKVALRRIKKMGIEGVVFGDISEVPGHGKWVDKVCSEVGLIPIRPLWGHDPKQVLRDFINNDFEATVIKVKSDLLGEQWLGRSVDKRFLSDLLDFKGEINLCGELGEYHTYITDGPIFKKHIKLLKKDKILKDGYWYLDITRYELISKKRFRKK
ncbi:MAG: diphthine--ammonia ligase [Promethearchaeota archaeon]